MSLVVLANTKLIIKRVYDLISKLLEMHRLLLFLNIGGSLLNHLFI